MHCHVVLPVLLVADSAYHNAVGGRCIVGGLLRLIELHVIHTVRYSLIVLFLFCLEDVCIEELHVCVFPPTESTW